jgi:ankyrin repeat protein
VAYGAELTLEAWLTAASENQPQILQAFIDRGWDVNTTDDQGETALHLACLEGHRAIVDLLFQAGAKLDLLSASGDSPLLQAIQQADRPLVAHLLENGADPNLGQGDDRPLLTACCFGDTELVRQLLQAGADPNTVYGTGQSALAWVADQGNLELLDLLLQAGANPNQTDPRGITPLMWASHRGHHPIVVRLLQVPGINLHCHHQGGLTALALAENNHFSGIVACLRQAGATV